MRLKKKRKEKKEKIIILAVMSSIQSEEGKLNESFVAESKYQMYLNCENVTSSKNRMDVSSMK